MYPLERGDQREIQCSRLRRREARPLPLELPVTPAHSSRARSVRARSFLAWVRPAGERVSAALVRLPVELFQTDYFWAAGVSAVVAWPVVAWEVALPAPAPA